MVPFDIDVSTVSWIDKKIMSIFSGLPNPLADEAWVDLLCYGTSHTANPEPPDVLHGQDGAAVLGKQYRSFTTFSIQLQVDSHGTFQSVRQLPNSNTVLDPGYTPPFDSGFELWKGLIGQALISPDPMLPGKMHAEATTFSPGEKSSLSQIVVPGTQWQSNSVKPLAYSSINVRPGEVILGHTLIKFRAGTQGDYIGVVGMGCPNHLPWVWCEAMLAYQDKYNLVLYGAGSGFPCHAFYVGGRRQGRLDLTTDRNKLKQIFASGLKANVNFVMGETRMWVSGINAQAPTQETSKAGQTVTSQPFDAPANDKSIRLVIPLSSLACWK